MGERMPGALGAGPAAAWRGRSDVVGMRCVGGVSLGRRAEGLKGVFGEVSNGFVYAGRGLVGIAALVTWISVVTLP